jgi:DNA polymerase-1
MLNRLVLNAMMKGDQPRVVLVFDAPGKNFRHGIYEAYKANRAEAPVDLIPQFPLIREVAKAYGIAQVEAPSYEADDVIATLATMALAEGLDCNILSGDKDLMQLVTPT